MEYVFSSRQVSSNKSKAWFPLVAEPDKNAKVSHCGHAGFCSRLTARMLSCRILPEQ